MFSLNNITWTTGPNSKWFYTVVLHIALSQSWPGPVAQVVACPIADPAAASLIPAWSHTSVEIDHEIISMVILLLRLI